MGLLNWLTARPAEALVTELAETIAAECHENVWQQAAGRAGTMPSAVEVRSYLRTRAAGVVSRRVRRIVRTDPRIGIRAADPIAERALALIVGRLMGPMMQPRAVCAVRRAA